MSQYISYDEFTNSPYGRDYLPGTDELFSTSGDIVDFLIDISSLVDLYCNRSFEMNRYVQEFQGMDEKVLFVNQMPATGIVSVSYKTFWSVGAYLGWPEQAAAYASASGIIDPSRYYLFTKTGKVRFLDLLHHYNIYTVTYDAGYANIPNAIKQATLMLANSYAQSIENGAVAFVDGGANTQFRFNKFQEQYADPRHKTPTYSDGIPLTVKAILDRFRITHYA